MTCISSKQIKIITIFASYIGKYFLNVNIKWWHVYNDMWASVAFFLEYDSALCFQESKIYWIPWFSNPLSELPWENRIRLLGLVGCSSNVFYNPKDWRQYKGLTMRRG